MSAGGHSSIVLPVGQITNQEWCGFDVILTAGENLTITQAVYMKNDGKMWKAQANAAATMPCIALAAGTISANNNGVFLLIGFFREDTVFDFAAGDILYVNDTVAGALTTTAPADSGEQVQCAGKCFPNAHIVYFCPSPVLVEIS